MSSYMNSVTSRINAAVNAAIEEGMDYNQCRQMLEGHAKVAVSCFGLTEERYNELRGEHDKLAIGGTK